MKKTLIIGDREIVYQFTKKRVKNINIRIKPTGEILVSASPLVRESTVEDFVASKSDFILNALEKFEKTKQYAPVSPALISGEKILFKGEFYTLFIIKGKSKITLDSQSLILSLPDPDDFAKKQKLLMDFYKAEAQRIIESLCLEAFPLFEKYTKGFPLLKYRNMKTRWGSCQPCKNILSFNIKLAKIPVELSRYVVFHEFTHFIEPNHQKGFYGKLKEYLPDYRQREIELKKYNYLSMP